MKIRFKAPVIFLVSIFISYQCEDILKTEIKIETGTVLDHSFTSVEIEGEIIAFGKGISDYGHCWSKSKHPTHDLVSRTSLGETKSTGVFTSELTSLSAGTVYYVRAYALNEDNEVVYGDEIEIETQSYALPAVNTSAPTAVSHTMAVLGGEILSNGGDSVTERGVFFGVQSNPSGSGNGTKLSIGRDNGYFSDTASGLSPSTTYYVEAFGVNSAGMGIGGQQSFVTEGLAPEAEFSASKITIQVGESVQFSDLSSNNPTDWSWDFGDGSSSSIQNPVHSYNEAGSYTITLTASNEFGSNSTTKSGYISAGRAPTALFSASKTKPKVGEAIVFSDHSQNNPTYWEWSFGDGGASSEQNPSHSYGLPGVYTVQLTVSNDFGTDTKILSDYILPNYAPIAAFGVSDDMPKQGEAVHFTDKSSHEPTSWTWDFGDGQSSHEQNPVHTYSSAGIYTVELTVTNDYGSDSEAVSEALQVMLTDIDGFAYEVVKIGEQTWMAENLQVSRFPDGSQIDFVHWFESWEGSWYWKAACNPAFFSSNKAKYGVFYTYWATVNGEGSSDDDPRQGVCPDGWHVPNKAEWEELAYFLGGTAEAGAALKEAGDVNWEAPNTGASNSSGFTALPGGFYEGGDDWSDMGRAARFWTATQQEFGGVWDVYLMNTSKELKFTAPYGGGPARSVRCIKND